MLPGESVIVPSVLPSKVALELAPTPKAPPLRLFSVPPSIVAPPLISTVPPLAVMFAPALATRLVMFRVPLPVASRSPALTTFPVPLTNRVWPEALASIVPAASLANARPPCPMIPYPWKVLSTLVRVRPPLACWTHTWPLSSPLLRVTTPPPWSVVLAATYREVLFPLPAASWIVPLLTIVPRRDVFVLRPPV